MFSPNEMVFDFALMDVIENHIIAAIHDDVIGTEPDIPIAEIRDLAIINVTNHKMKWKVRFDQKHSKPTLYKINDLVVIENEPAATVQKARVQIYRTVHHFPNA